jgi:tRNA 2-(methylsulfanyl)-N6-isopentenyladenosine37 hydroxylase
MGSNSILLVPTCYLEIVIPAVPTFDDAVVEKLATLPLHSRTPLEWSRAALSDPIALLIDHAFLEKKAANNAMDLLARWPADFFPAWVETMTQIARDEGAHLAQVTRLLIRRGGALDRGHQNPYAKALRALVRKGAQNEILDRLYVSALIEARSCERFGVLAATCGDPELAAFYHALFFSELSHYQAFLDLAYKVAPENVVNQRWQEILALEAQIMAEQEPGPRIHSGWA